MRLGFCIALLFAACAATQARPKLPGTFGSGENAPTAGRARAGRRVGARAPADGAGRADCRSPPIPGAEADFREAKARFDAGAQAEAAHPRWKGSSLTTASIRSVPPSI